MAKTFTNPLVLKVDTMITADKILEGIEILRFQGLVPNLIKFSMIDQCPECSEPSWGLFIIEEGVELEAEEPLGICFRCNSTICMETDGKTIAHKRTSEDLLKGIGIGKGK
ncbi:MAG: hypothetical protein L0Y68_07095 [Candidatus Dadabacteria bacterium]|nr:hypothetical protein [Candidatus Dadabacteria bacterium]